MIDTLSSNVPQIEVIDRAAASTAQALHEQGESDKGHCETAA